MEENFEKAIAIMQEYVGQVNEDFLLTYDKELELEIKAELTKDYDCCWVFFYQTKDVTDLNKIYVGNGPILCKKENLECYVLGTGQDIHKQVEEFSKRPEQFIKLHQNEWGEWVGLPPGS